VCPYRCGTHQGRGRFRRPRPIDLDPAFSLVLSVFALGRARQAADTRGIDRLETLAVVDRVDLERRSLVVDNVAHVERETKA
jgi:hypothetical protein